MSGNDDPTASPHGGSLAAAGKSRNVDEGFKAHIGAAREIVDNNTVSGPCDENDDTVVITTGGIITDIAVAIHEAVLAEREACAVIAELLGTKMGSNTRSFMDGADWAGMEIADRIRSRPSPLDAPTSGEEKP